MKATFDWSSLLSLKNGLELILTFLILTQIVYLLLNTNRSKVFWAHLAFLGLLFLHFVSLNAAHYFQAMLIDRSFFYVLYGPTLLLTMHLIRADKGPVGGLELPVSLAISLIIYFWGPKWLLTVNLTGTVVYALRSLNTASTVATHRWFRVQCLYFITLVAIFPLSWGLVNLENYLYFKIPYSLFFGGFLLHNFSFFLGKPNFFVLQSRPLDGPEDRRLLARIEKAFVDDKIHRKNSLTLRDISSELGVPTYKISKTLNKAYGKAFPELVNHFRISDIKEWLTSPSNGHLKLEALAYEAGFTTPSAFYAAFKKETGMTPKRFQREHAGGAGSSDSAIALSN